MLPSGRWIVMRYELNLRDIRVWIWLYIQVSRHFWGERGAVWICDTISV